LSGFSELANHLASDLAQSIVTPEAFEKYFGTDSAALRYGLPTCKTRWMLLAYFNLLDWKYSNASEGKGIPLAVPCSYSSKMQEERA
jgi:hypothetical protein